MSDTIGDIFNGMLPVERVQTFRSGVFTFQVGVDRTPIEPLLDRVNDAKNRFSSMPVLPDIAIQLEREVLASSVFGTNTIEGATLTEEETAAILAGRKAVTEEKERRVENIRSAYSHIETVASEILKRASEFGQSHMAVELKEFVIKDLHKKITQGLTHRRNIPGEYRNNERGEKTLVGDAEHGGVYLAPKCRDDVEILIKALIQWINSKGIRDLNPLIRAPLFHYYFERVHPFWDGNGRIGRVLEAFILKCSGFKYAPFAMSRYYLERIDEYFSVFNAGRRAEEKNQDYPNTIFVRFFLEGMIQVINKLHDRTNSLISFLLYDVTVNNMVREKKINQRQHTIILNLISRGLEHDLDKVRTQPWYRGLYENLTERTEYRDIRRMVEQKLIEIRPNKKLRIVLPGH